MIRFVIALLLSCAFTSAFAQETMSPVVGQRVLRILDRAGDDTQLALDNLAEYANQRGVRANDRAFIIREQAALLIREERNAEALALLRAELEGKAENFVPPVRLLYAQLLLLEGDSSAALSQLETWSTYTENPHPIDLSMLAYAYLQQQRWGEGAAVFERVLELSEVDSDQWYEMLAFAYAQNGEAERAITLLDQRIVADSSQAKWWRHLATIFLLLEDYEKGTAGIAIANYVEELRFQDSKRLAGLFSMLNMPAEGAATLEAALQRFPGQLAYEDQMLLAELWMLAREQDKAIQAFERASELAEDGEAVMKIAQMHLQWERYEQARTALEDARFAYGEDTPETVFYLQAIVEINLDNLEAASQALNRLDEEGDFGERAANLDRFIKNQRANALLQ